MKLSEEKIREMEKIYSGYWWSEEEEEEYREISSDPFKLLIFTILSQNTSGINTRRAYRNLNERFKIDAFSLSKAEEHEIAEAIRHGGLYRVKARKIKEVSKYLLENYEGRLDKILKMDMEKARKELLKLPGVGNKTADVILASIYGQRKAFVVDTHMRRIAIRLGLVNEKANYDEIEKKLKEIFPWEKLKGKEDRVAGLFWLLAKHTCRAINPKCEECILKEDCRFYLTQK